MAIGDFGKRSTGGLSTTSNPSPLFSPLLKQIGGIVLGALLVTAIGAAARYGMTQFGKSLDGQFVERARPGDSQGTFATIDDPDQLLRNIHNSCTALTSRQQLTDAQRNTIDGPSTSWLIVSEEQLLRSGDYVACLATESTHRFCTKAHRQHLAQATGEYFKQLRQTREEWILRSGPPEHANRVFARGGTLKDADLQSPQGVPSRQVDLAILRGLQTLAERGLVNADDFAALSFDARQGITPAFTHMTAKRSACSRVF